MYSESRRYSSLQGVRARGEDMRSLGRKREAKKYKWYGGGYDGTGRRREMRESRGCIEQNPTVRMFVKGEQNL